jgi:hypothetical protein
MPTESTSIQGIEGLKPEFNSPFANLSSHQAEFQTDIDLFLRYRLL